MDAQTYAPFKAQATLYPACYMYMELFVSYSLQGNTVQLDLYNLYLSLS